MGKCPYHSRVDDLIILASGFFLPLVLCPEDSYYCFVGLVEVDGRMRGDLKHKLSRRDLGGRHLIESNYYHRVVK